MALDSRTLVLTAPAGARQTWVHVLVGLAVTLALALAAVIAAGSAPSLALLLGFLAFLCATYPAAAIAVGRRRPELRLTEEGFTVSGPMHLAVPWSAVERFAVLERRGRRLVAFDYSADSDLASIGRWVRRFAGHDAALTDSYGKDPDDLAALMEAWRRAAMRRAADGSRTS